MFSHDTQQFPARPSLAWGTREKEALALIPPGAKVLCGLSGGGDSVALLHWLASHRESRGFSLCAAHLDHSIRPESAEDAAFAQDLCARWQVPFFTQRIDIPKLAHKTGQSLEVAAREARRAFLLETAAREEATLVALAHHAHDQAETVLMHLSRGAGARGLGGMAPKQGLLIRPFLTITKPEILAYLVQHSLPFREDATNADLAIPRNLVRCQVLPPLEGLYPGAARAMAQAAAALRKDEEYLLGEAEKLLHPYLRREGDGWFWAEEGFAGRPEVLLARAVRTLLEDALGHRECTARHVKAVLALLQPGSVGKRAVLPGGTATRRYGGLAVLPGCSAQSEPEGPGASSCPPNHSIAEPVTLPVPGYAALPNGTVGAERLPTAPANLRPSAYEVYLAGDIALPLQVRYWQPGDKMWPLGAPGNRKLQDIFTDRKVDRERRGRIPLVLDSQGKILWVCTGPIAHHARVQDTAAPVLRLRWEKR